MAKISDEQLTQWVVDEDCVHESWRDMVTMATELRIARKTLETARRMLRETHVIEQDGLAEAFAEYDALT